MLKHSDTPAMSRPRTRARSAGSVVTVAQRGRRPPPSPSAKHGVLRVARSGSSGCDPPSIVRKTVTRHHPDGRARRPPGPDTDPFETGLRVRVRTAGPCWSGAGRGVAHHQPRPAPRKPSEPQKREATPLTITPTRAKLKPRRSRTTRPPGRATARTRCPATLPYRAAARPIPANVRHGQTRTRTCSPA